MNYRLFNHEGCRSAQCIRRVIADKARVMANITDPKDIAILKVDFDAAVREYDRMMDEKAIFTVNP